MKLHILSLAFTLLLFSCIKPEVQECVDVNYGELFTIVKSGHYCFPDGNQFTVESMTNDFCPCNLDCFWEGQMVMQFTAIIENETYTGIIGSANHFDTIFCKESYIMKFGEIELVQPCTDSNPNPAIKNAELTVYH